MLRLFLSNASVNHASESLAHVKGVYSLNLGVNLVESLKIFKIVSFLSEQRSVISVVTGLQLDLVYE